MKITLYKDDNGNFWYDEGFDEKLQVHEVVAVDEDQGHYTYTHKTFCMSKEELNECTKVEVEVD